MNHVEEPQRASAGEPAESLRRLEARLARIEAYLQLGPLPAGTAPPVAAPAGEPGAALAPHQNEAEETALEFRIGEFWLARVGIVALLVGTALFIAYPMTALPPLLQHLLGYLAVAGLFAFSRFGRRAYPYLSRILFGGGMLLLYYATLRLHFFTDTPLLANRALTVALLLMLVAGHGYFAVRRQSEVLAVATIFLGNTTALLAEATPVTLALVVLTAAAAMYFLLKHNFKVAGLLSVVLAYATHLLWLLNNPVLGHPLQAVAAHQNNFVYLFAAAVIFAVPPLLRREETLADTTKILLPLLNGAGFYGAAFLVVLTFFETQSALCHFGFALLFLTVATLAWVLRQSRFATSFYACFGYLALSAAIFARFEAPQYFIWLGWQSLLVISTAIWFRSQIVVVANTFIYLGIFALYFITAPATGAVNLSYATVALFSARLLNWKTERLALKTELMRNAYLFTAFVIIPYGLYHAVPQNYVSLSWLAAAVFYFAMSLVLHSKKYRWMAILTLFLAVIYVFAIDLARLEPGYRILSFLALGLVLLVISLLYARSHLRSREASQE